DTHSPKVSIRPALVGFCFCPLKGDDSRINPASRNGLQPALSRRVRPRLIAPSIYRFNLGWAARYSAKRSLPNRAGTWKFAVLPRTGLQERNCREVSSPRPCARKKLTRHISP